MATATATAGYRALFRHRDYLRLWVASNVSLVGSAITRVAFPVAVYERTASPVALGGAVVVQTLAQALTGLVSGPIADRASRKAIICVVPLAQAACVASLAVAPELWHLFALSFVSSSLGILAALARFAALPDVVGDDLMPYAAATGQISQQAMQIIGPALGGIIVAVAGTRVAFLIDAATFMLGVALIAAMRVPQPPRTGEPVPPLADLFTGVRYIWSRPATRFLAFGDLAGDIGYTVLLTLTVVLATSVLGGDSRLFGLLIATQAAAFVVSAMLVPRFASRKGAMRFLTTGGQVVAGMGLLLVAAWPTLPGSFLGYALLGLGTAPGWTLGSVLWTRLVPSELRGRAAGASEVAAMLVQFAAALAIGGAAAQFGTRLAYGGAGIAQILAVLVSAVAFWRGFQALRDV